MNFAGEFRWQNGDIGSSSRRASQPASLIFERILTKNGEIFILMITVCIYRAYAMKIIHNFGPYLTNNYENHHCMLVAI